MGKELDRLVNEFCEMKYDKVFSDNSQEEDINELKNIIKIRLKQNIVNEVKYECEQEILENAKKEIKKNEQLKKINEIKTIVWSGFIVSFLVGVLVNQVTDIISFLKGIITIKSIYPTVLICLILLVICVFAFIWTFITKIIDLFRGK